MDNNEILNLELFDNVKVTDLYKYLFETYLSRKNRMEKIADLTEQNLGDKSDLAIILPNYNDLLKTMIENEKIPIEILSNLKDLIKAINTSKSINNQNNILEELKNLTLEDLEDINLDDVKELEENIGKNVEKKLEKIEKKIEEVTEKADIEEEINFDELNEEFSNIDKIKELEKENILYEEDLNNENIDLQSIDYE